MFLIHIKLERVSYTAVIKEIKLATTITVAYATYSVKYHKIIEYI